MMIPEYLFQAIVKLAVRLRRDLPAKIHRHRLPLYKPPERRSRPQHESAANSAQQRPGITVLKHKPAGDAIGKVFQRAVGHRVSQSTGTPYQRQRAVLQPVELR